MGEVTSEDERLQLAEEFVRRAIQHFEHTVSEDDIMAAAKKAAKCIPPFRKLADAVTKRRAMMSNVNTIVDDIMRVCAGRNTAEVYTAIAVVLGAAASRATRPDLDDLIRLIGVGAREEFERQMAERTSSAH